jgi:hypothetical protein
MFRVSRFTGKIVIVLAMLVLTGTASGSDRAVLTGRVLDTSGRPVSGAEVYVYRSENIRRPADYISPRTGPDGTYRLVLPPGTYYLVARWRRSPGYGPLMPGDRHSGEPVELELRPGETISQDFTVMDTREAVKAVKGDLRDVVLLRGCIRQSDGTPVRGVFVFATENDRPEKLPRHISRWVDREGCYSIFLPPGEYRIGYSRSFPLKEGSWFIIKSFRLEGKGEVDFDFRLD